MATFTITAPDGNTYEITAPEGATEAQVLEYAKANYAKTVASLTSGEYISSMLLKKSCISTNAK